MTLKPEKIYKEKICTRAWEGQSRFLKVKMEMKFSNKGLYKVYTKSCV